MHRSGKEGVERRVFAGREAGVVMSFDMVGRSMEKWEIFFSTSRGFCSLPRPSGRMQLLNL